jgi:hypothetical protein
MVSMYGPEHFLHNGIIDRPWPEPEIGPVPAPQLYNIAADPFERTDQSTAHPEIAARLARELASWFDEVERDRATTPESIARTARWREMRSNASTPERSAIAPTMT